MSRLEGQRIGEKSEMKVAIDLIDNGCRVAYTHGHAHPYDLIADKDSDLLKIQVKTAKHRDRQKYDIKLSTPEKYDAEDVDLFAGYAVEKDEVFYVPFAEMGNRASVTFTPLEEMSSDWHREKAKHATDYTFEAARARLPKNGNIEE